MSAFKNFEKEMEAIGDRMVARIDRELNELNAELTPQFEALAAKVENAYDEYETTSNAILERLRNELDELGLLKKDDDDHNDNHNNDKPSQDNSDMHRAVKIPRRLRPYVM